MADNRRTCGHCGCEHYSHRHLLSTFTPTGLCDYTSQKLQVHPGDNCIYGLLEKSAQSQPEDAACTNFDSQNPQGR